MARLSQLLARAVIMALASAIILAPSIAPASFAEDPRLQMPSAISTTASATQTN